MPNAIEALFSTKSNLPYFAVDGRHTQFNHAAHICSGCMESIGEHDERVDTETENAVESYHEDCWLEAIYFDDPLEPSGFACIQFYAGVETI